MLSDFFAEDGKDTLNRPLEDFAKLYLGIYDENYNFTLLDSHLCTEEDFDAFYDLSDQFKQNEYMVKDLIRYSLCFNEEDLWIRGHDQMVDFRSLFFSVLIPDHQCRYDPNDFQCSGSYEYELSMSKK